AANLQARLSDAVIESALRRMPPEHYALSAGEVGAAIRGRRDGMRVVAARLYAQLVREAEVHSTDERERAEVERFPDGSVEVRISELNRAGAARAPFYRRRFDPRETREIRLDLHGGDDHAVVYGAAPSSILVRVLGGGGDDVLEDRSRVPGTRTAFYDSRGENRFVPGPGTKVDPRPWEEPEHVRGNLSDPPRTWGASSSLFSASAGWRSNVGPVVGVGPAFTRYGFRRHPYAEKWRLQAMYAPLYNRFGVEYTGDFRRVGSDARLEVLARVSNMEVTRFHGFGNETGESGDGDRYKVWHTVVRVEPLWSLRERNDVVVSLGPVLRFYDAEMDDDVLATQLRPRGSEAFGEAGGQGWAVWDTRDSEDFPRSGVRVRAGGVAFPAVWELDGPFGRAEAEATGFLSLPGERGPTLALRGGAVRAWGDFPFQEAAFVGGSRSLRGFSHQRFAGETALYGNAEVRAPLVYTNLGVRGWLGVTGLFDVGRVYAEGESSDRWHSAPGAGLWFATMERSTILGVTYARGERDRVYFHLGFPF
ncbi:MAG TPA: BamA/TamA family outer membrane protein, partial [Longimicrobiaceae bacterium]